MQMMSAGIPSRSRLSHLAFSENALIFPWLPDWKTIEIALNLNIKVYAGYPELDRALLTDDFKIGI